MKLSKNWGRLVMKFNELQLGEICSRLSSGKSISAKLVYNHGKYPVYGGNGLRGYTDTYNFEGKCAIIGRQGVFCGNVRYFEGSAYMTEHAVVVCTNDEYNIRYLSYLLSTMNLGRLSAQSAQPGLSVKTLSKQIINMPDLETQNKIASILSALDDKIEVNQKINENLEQQAQAIFKSWFVDFEPFGGVMPNDWKIGTIDNIVEFYDSKRVPLSGKERMKMKNKIYPYYGAASLMDYVDNYIFDGKYLLMGEDGTVIDELGFPILQYVWGKFWVNNHAHVLTGKCGFNVESLMLLLMNTNVKRVVTGAVQPKISQSNLKSIQINIPAKDILDKFNNVIEPLFSQIRINIEQNNKLVKLRDTLLPKLMNGEIDVNGK